MSRRLFYDPVDPRMLTADEIGKLSPTEIQAACDQIDQNLVGVLQRIDENFSKAYQSLTANILPAVEQYGQHSKDIWDSVKFWKFFFEAAANTKLGEPSLAADESFRSADLNETVVSFAQDEQAEQDRTPRAANETAGTDSSDSPFQTLRKEIRALDVLPPSVSSQASSTSMMMMSAANQHRHHQRLRLHELPPDSPDIPLPEFETLKISMSPMPLDPLEGIAAASHSPRRPKAGSDKALHPDLLQKVLRKQLDSAAKEKTPKVARGKAQRPSDVPADWDGIVKLSDTPLSAFMSPRPAQTSSSSSNQASSGALASPLPKLGRTPKKDAAPRTVQNVYDASFDFDMDSPEPPSAMKNWRTQPYDVPSLSPLKLSLNRAANVPSSLASKREGVITNNDALLLSQGPDESLELDLPPPRVADLQDFGGTTARIDDLLNQDSLARLIDDDEQDHDARRAAGSRGGAGSMFDDEEDTSGTGTGTSVATGARAAQQDPFGADDNKFGRGAALPRSLLEGPEDTLFGMPDPALNNNKQRANVRFNHPSDDASSSYSTASVQGHQQAAGRKGGNKFKVLGIREHEMETLHGGQLLESEPYVESPLMKRDNRY